MYTQMYIHTGGLAGVVHRPLKRSKLQVYKQLIHLVSSCITQVIQ